MNKNGIGCVLVPESDKIIGLITDRGIAVKVVNQNAPPPLFMIQNHGLRLFSVEHNKNAKSMINHSDLADAVIKNNLYGQPLAQKVVKFASKLAS